jgi:Mannosyltransferase (PIG-V)
MSSDTAEPAIADPASELAGARRRVQNIGSGEPLNAEVERTGFSSLVSSVGHLRADAAQRRAVRDVWRALWSSRLLVWLAGVGTVLAFGAGPTRHAFNPSGLTRGLGWLGDVLAAPVARWDAAWYLVIAHYGYRPELGAFTASRSAFFPLYPLGVHLLTGLGPSPVVAGVTFSVLALAIGLYGLHRLTALEIDRLQQMETDDMRRLRGRVRAEEVARLAVLLTALAPMAFYFSAIYSESLYLALSVGVFLYARRGRWVIATTLAALAGATRSSGVVLMLPLVLLYLYGPRADRMPDRPPPTRGANARKLLDFGSLYAALRPRYALRRDATWLALVPLGLVIYMAYLALAGGDALAPFHAEGMWNRHFAAPYSGVWDGARAAFEGLRQLLSFQRHHLYYPAAGGSPFIDAGHNLLLFVFLLGAIPALLGALRLLPLAYGLYVFAALAVPLSYPVAPQPLMSLPRFLVVLFPLNIWLAVHLASRPPVLTRLALAGSVVAMMFFVGEFATWHWVA